MHINNGSPPVPGQGVSQYLNSVSEASKANEIKKTSPDNPERGNNVNQDKVTLSKRALEISRIKTAVTEVPDVRNDKVAALQKEIEQGTYNVSGSQVVEKMLQESSVNLLI